MTGPLPPATVHGLEGSAWARREEATRALLFLAQVEALAASVQSMEPDGRLTALAVLAAREEAVHAVALWRAAVTEMRRAAAAEAKRGPRLVGP